MKSTKSQTPNLKDINYQLNMEEPNQFEVLLKKDNLSEEENENPSQNLNSNLNIDQELKNIIKETKINEEKENKNIVSNTERKRMKYFEDINNSSIAKKEESLSELNTNKKSQNSDFALFKIVNEIGNKNSGNKVLESLEKSNPLNSISTNNKNKLNIKISKIEEENIKAEDIKSEKSDFISNVDDNDNDNKDEDNDHVKKSNINKINIELLFKPNEEKKEINIKEIKKLIIENIDNLYEKSHLNLVKLNNHEIFNFITDYNDISKDNLDYEPYYYKLTDKDEKFISRRNNYLSHNYFSYIIKQKNEKKYNYESIKKYKIDYNEKITDIKYNNYSDLKISKNTETKKEPKIYDVENITSFFYNFGIYIPSDNNDILDNNKKTKNKNKIIDEKIEEGLINTIISYRKIYNDGHSFQRCFSYLLFETFLMKNKINKIECIMNNMKKILKNKYLEIDNTLNILNKIKENSSILDLMEGYNNSETNIDEIMITYIEDIINNINNIDIINKTKCQEIDYIYLKTLCDIFDINLNIFYIEENKNKNKFNSLLKLNNINIECESYTKNKNIQTNISESSELNLSQNYPTLYLLYFINSYHIIYTNKSDIDSTFANNEFPLQYYYLPSLPKYICPKCEKNQSLDIVPYYEAVFCHKCLINYAKKIIEKRVICFIKNGFSSIEYYTRPLTIKSEIKINITLYKYITGNYFIKDFEFFLNNICFICYKFFFKKNNNENNKEIIKLKCRCQICNNCLEDKKKEIMGGYNYLNLYELHTKKMIKCPCDNYYDINELMKYSKIKYNDNDVLLANQRLKLILLKKCCKCLLNFEDNIENYKLHLINTQIHYICKNCYKKNIIKQKNKEIKQHENRIEKKDKNKIYYNDLESSDSSLKDNNDKNKEKIFCKICNTEHVIEIKETDNKKNKNNNINNNKKRFEKSTDKCCGKCLIF